MTKYQGYNDSVGEKVRGVEAKMATPHLWTRRGVARPIEAVSAHRLFTAGKDVLLRDYITVLVHVIAENEHLVAALIG